MIYQSFYWSRSFLKSWQWIACDKVNFALSAKQGIIVDNVPVLDNWNNFAIARHENG